MTTPQLLLPNGSPLPTQLEVDANSLRLQLLEPELLVSAKLSLMLPSPPTGALSPRLTTASGPFDPGKSPQPSSSWIMASLPAPATLTSVSIKGTALPSHLRIKACQQGGWVPLLPSDLFCIANNSATIAFPPLCASALQLEFGTLAEKGLWQPNAVSQITELQLATSTAPGDLSLAISGQAPFWQHSGLLTAPAELGDALVAACEDALAARTSSGPLTLLLRAGLPGSLSLAFAPGPQRLQSLTGADLPTWQAIPLCWHPQLAAGDPPSPAPSAATVPTPAPAVVWQSQGSLRSSLPSGSKLRGFRFSLQPLPPQRCLPPPPPSVAIETTLPAGNRPSLNLVPARHFLHASGGEALAQAIDLSADSAGEGLSLLGLDLPLLARSDHARATLTLHGDDQGVPAAAALQGDPLALGWPALACQGDANGWLNLSLAEPLSLPSGRVWVVLRVVEGSLLWPLFGSASAPWGPCLRRPAAQGWLPLSVAPLSAGAPSASAAATAGSDPSASSSSGAPAASVPFNHAAALRLRLADPSADPFPSLQLRLGNVSLPLTVGTDGRVALDGSSLQRLNQQLNAATKMDLSLEACGANPGPLMVRQLLVELVTPLPAESRVAKP